MSATERTENAENDPDWLAAQPEITALTKKIGAAMNGHPMPVCAAALTQAHAMLIMQAPSGDQDELAQAAGLAIAGTIADFRNSRH